MTTASLSAFGARQAILPVVLACLLLAGCAAQQRTLPPDNGRDTPDATPDTRPDTQPAKPQTLEEMLQQDDFDLPRALLLFSAKYYGEFAAEPYTPEIEPKLARFEAYTQDLRKELRRDRSPRMRLRTLANFVHVKLGLRFDQNDTGGTNPENLFFDRVLTRRFGYCVTLSMAYIVFGQAAGLDVRGVRIPGHFAVIYTDAENDGTPFKTLVETTANGAMRDELQYWSEHRFHVNAVEAGVYLTPLTDKGIFSTLYNNLGGISFLADKFELALERYGRAIELAPNNAEALYNRAVVLRNRKRYSEALRDVNSALRLDPNFTLALLVRAALFWEEGEKDSARADLATAMKQRPEWPEPHMLDGGFLMRDRKLDDARKAFERVLELNPAYKSAHIALAELEQAAGNPLKAQKHMAAAQD
jgi:regulator of sirC expression with transglutaminase-like and TPR domain